MFKNEQEALNALRSTLSDLEALTKSWDSKIAEGDDMEKSDEDLEKAEGDMPPPAPEDPSQDPSMAPGEPDGDEGQMAPPPVDGAAPEEGAGDDDMMSQISQEASQLSDEELDMMLHALMSEKDTRGAQGQDPAAGMDPAAAGAPPAAPAPAPQPQEKSLAMSMKEEFNKLNKSFNSQIEDLKKSVSNLQSENIKLKQAQKHPTSKPAASNRVEVLEKSVKAPQRLNKSEAQNYLLGEMRKGNKSVTSDLVATFGAAHSENDMNYAYNYAADLGIEIPAKK